LRGRQKNWREKMTEQENSPLEGNAKHNLDERSPDNAKATDSWLIYLARDLGRVFRWGKNEIDLLVDSAGGAFSTTEKITERMVRYSKREMERGSFRALADRADDGFLSIARSAGEAVCFIQSSTMDGFSKIKYALSRRKKEKESKQPSRTGEIKESAPPGEMLENSGSSSPGVTGK